MYFLDKSALLKHHFSPNKDGLKSKPKTGHLSDGDEEKKGAKEGVLPQRTNQSTITHKQGK